MKKVVVQKPTIQSSVNDWFYDQCSPQVDGSLQDLAVAAALKILEISPLEDKQPRHVVVGLEEGAVLGTFLQTSELDGSLFLVTHRGGLLWVVKIVLMPRWYLWRGCTDGHYRRDFC